MLAERKKDSSPRRLHAALSFSRDSPSLPSHPPFPCPAFSCVSFAHVVQHGEQTGFAIKRILSRNVRDQREDLTYNAQTGSRSFHFSLSCALSFSLPPSFSRPHPRHRRLFLRSSNAAPPFAFSTISFVRDIPSSRPSSRSMTPSERDVRKKGRLKQLRVVRKVQVRSLPTISPDETFTKKIKKTERGEKGELTR